MQQESLSHSSNVCLGLPSHRLTHIFRLVSRVDARINGTVESHIEAANGRVESWTMARRVDVLEHKIVVDGLSEPEAKALRDQLSALDGSLKAHLEHLLWLPRDNAV